MYQWALQHPVDPGQVLFFSKMFDLALSSDSYEQLCQRVVHDELTQSLIHGAHLYSVDSNLDLELQISHGKTTALVVPVISAWGNSPLAKCIVEKQMQFHVGKADTHIVLPLVKSSIPVGVLLLVMDRKVDRSVVSEPVAQLFSQVGAFFMEVRPRHSPLARTNGNGSSHSPERLTTRQIQIIQLIGAGLTNAQIGRDVALSESTIRQETIRIYKSLDVSGRDEAVKAARKMGLVSKE